MRRVNRLYAAIAVAIVASGCSANDATPPPVEVETATTPASSEAPRTLEANDRLKSWGVDRILVETTKLGVTAYLVAVDGQPLATMTMRFEGLRSNAHIAGKHGELTLAIMASDDEYSMK